MTTHCPTCHSPYRAVHGYTAHHGFRERCRDPWHDEEEEERLFRALHKIFEVLQEIHLVEIEIRDLLVYTTRPRASRVNVRFGDPMPLAVGASTTATLTVLDQNGQPMPYDLVANPPQWQADANASIAPGSNPNDEIFTGVSGGIANWSVTVPGVVNPTASGSFEVSGVAVEATSVAVSFSPSV